MKIASSLLLIVCCVLALAPLAWHASSSFKTAADIASIPPALLPNDPTLANYTELFVRRPFAFYYLNSFVIATLASLLCTFAASMSAYALARTAPGWRRLVTSGLLVAAFFPPIVLLFPLYEFNRTANLLNHPWGLIIPYAALNLPFSIWLLTGYFAQIPVEIEEAAAVDGLSPWQTLWRVVLPLSAPALATTGLLAFVFAWNEFLFALTFMNMETAKTLTAGVATLSGAFALEIPWGLLAAAVMASSLPLIVLVLVFQKRIVAGLTAGAEK